MLGQFWQWQAHYQVFTGTSNFIDNINSANSTGNYNGGAISISENAVLTFHGNNNFINNSAGKHGGAIYT